MDDSSNSDESQDYLDLERLDTIIDTVQHRISSSSTCCSAIMMDSITPILMRHGYNKMMQFVQELVKVCRHKSKTILMVLPIRIEMFTSQQLSTFEHTMEWDAILNLVQPHVPDVTYNTTTASSHDDNTTIQPQQTALLIRRGVSLERRDYIRRDTVSYRVITITENERNYPDDNHMVNKNQVESTAAMTNNVLSLPRVRRRYCLECCATESPSENTNVPNNKRDDVTDTTNTAAAQRSTLPGTPTMDHITTKAVSLQLDDGSRRRRRYAPSASNTTTTTATTITGTTTTATKKVPNIFLEANDPDLYHNDDYDEDEPDDDLDL
jgi:hypothetical protein